VCNQFYHENPYLKAEIRISFFVGFVVEWNQLTIINYKWYIMKSRKDDILKNMDPIVALTTAVDM